MECYNKRMVKCRNWRGSAEDRDVWRSKTEEIQLGCSAKKKKKKKKKKRIIL